MKALVYVSESGHSLMFLSTEGRSYSLTLYQNGIPVFSRGYEYHQKHQAERERDALVSLGNMVEQVKVTVVSEGAE